MSATRESAAATGVQELIDRIRGQGVQAARDESDRMLAEARKEAAATRAKAHAEATAMVDAALAQIDTEKAAAAEAIRNAARDALLELRNEVQHAFEVHVRRLVSAEVEKTEFVRSLVLVLAGQAAEKFIKDKDAQIFVSSDAAGPEALKGDVRDKISGAVLGAAGQMLREGVQLFADDRIKGGARVRLVGQDLEIDMTDEALSRLLLKNLLPRYRAIVEEEEGAH